MGAFLGAGIAYFTGRDERMERHAVRGSMAGGLIATSHELAYHIA